MLTQVYDLKRIGESINFKTRLPKSSIGLLVSSLDKDGVTVYDIHDEDKDVVVSTSLCDVRMSGSWSVDDFKRKLRNEYYGFLNERFDKRVELLKSKGYNYYKEYACFAKSETSARNHCGIHTGVIMHEHDFLFNFSIG